MMKLDKKQSDLVKEIERRKKAKQSVEFGRMESLKVKKSSILTDILLFSKLWNDYCQAHEAYQFFRKKNADKYGNSLPAPKHP